MENEICMATPAHTGNSMNHTLVLCSTAKLLLDRCIGADSCCWRRGEYQDCWLWVNMIPRPSSSDVVDTSVNLNYGTTPPSGCCSRFIQQLQVNCHDLYFNQFLISNLLLYSRPKLWGVWRISSICTVVLWPNILSFSSFCAFWSLDCQHWDSSRSLWKTTV